MKTDGGGRSAVGEDLESCCKNVLANKCLLCLYDFVDAKKEDYREKDGSDN